METGLVSAARLLFDEMPQRDLIAWNIMIAGFVKNGYFTGALCFFNKMKVEGGVTPDSATLASVLSAVSELGRLRDGIAIHDYIRRKKLSLDGIISVALIDMYSKCGRLREALRVFEMSGRSVDHCNAMIGGLAIHGFGKLALELFDEMEELLLKPDVLAFISILSACSHAGLVEEGLVCFDIMRREYNLEPKVQQYGCMVDILGRAGLLEEAWKMIEDMPVEPNDVVWRSLLSACSNHGDLVLGRKVAENLIGRNPCSSSSFVLLSNLYAGLGLWADVSEVRLATRERDLRKVPGCSWIELDGVVHEFVVGDNSHPQAREIYSLLDELCLTSQTLISFVRLSVVFCKFCARDAQVVRAISPPLAEIARRKLAEEALEFLQIRWKELSHQLSFVGFSLPAPLIILQKLYASKLLLIGMWPLLSRRAVAEVELEMESQIESKNFEIAMLLDRLQYYEAANREMSQRNQEAGAFKMRQDGIYGYFRGCTPALG